MKTPKQKAIEVIEHFKKIGVFDVMEASLYCIGQIEEALNHEWMNTASNYRGEVSNYYGLVKLEIEEYFYPTP